MLADSSPQLAATYVTHDVQFGDASAEGGTSAGGGGTSAARAAEEPSAGLQALLAAAAAEDCEDDHVTGTKRDRELS